MRDWYKRHKQLIDQTLHVIVFGGAAILLGAGLAIGWLIVYELTPLHWRIGPLTIGQWPPGRPLPLPKTGRMIVQMDRVEDLRTDLLFSLAAIAVGDAIHAWIF